MIEVSEDQLRFVLTEMFLRGEETGRAEAFEEPPAKIDDLIERYVRVCKEYKNKA